MQYVHLGRSGVKVSRLCLGTMNFGPETSEADSFAIMDRALELGLNFFDTANVYGWKVGEGWTEQIVGRWLKQGGGRREKVVLAKIVSARFEREVLAGETLIYDARVLTLREEGASVWGASSPSRPGRRSQSRCPTSQSRKRRSFSPISTRRARNRCSATRISSLAANSSTCSAWQRSSPNARKRM